MSDQEHQASVLRRAATLMRERATAVPQGGWKGRPWQATECADDEAANCECIVYQGEYRPYTEAQVPLIQYVADAESAEHAAFIASWHPLVAEAVAAWLEAEAERAESRPGLLMHSLTPGPLAVALAYLGEAAGRG